MKTFRQALYELKACAPAVAFVGDSTLETAWDTCERGDWLLWLAHKAGVERKLIVSAAVACARTALKYTKDERVTRCLEVTEAWARGEATIEAVRDGRRAAAAAAYAAYAAAAAAAADAANAAVYAAYAAYAADAAYAANAAADAADAAANAATATANVAYAADAARKDAKKEQAALVRAVISLDVIRAALEVE